MPAENFFKIRHGFCFSEILYGISLQKVVCYQHSLYIHPHTSPAVKPPYSTTLQASVSSVSTVLARFVPSMANHQDCRHSVCRACFPICISQLPSFAVPTSRTASKLCVFYLCPLGEHIRIGTPQGTSGGSGSVISPYCHSVNQTMFITCSPF